MCEGVPLPREAKVQLTGLRLGRSDHVSRSDLTGAPGCAAISCGTLTISDTGAKSRSTS